MITKKKTSTTFSKQYNVSILVERLQQTYVFLEIINLCFKNIQIRKGILILNQQ